MKTFKKLTILFMVLFLCTGCEFIDTLIDGLGNIFGDDSSTTTTGVSYIDSTIYDDREGITTPTDFKIATQLDEQATPSTGNVKSLVLFVDFNNYIGDPDTIDDTMTAFNGESEETAWESVNSYYKKSSYNKLDLTATTPIKEWYRAEEDLAYYANYQATARTGVNRLLDEYLDQYDYLIDGDDYDSDNDGFIDAVYIIYSAPYGDRYQPEWYQDFYWAYVSFFPGAPTFQKIDGKNVGKICFVSADFVYDEPFTSKRSSNINSETFIHETGHLLGLDDYYDYDAEQGDKQGGLGGADMMDYNIGDHNVFSKTLLYWTNPRVISSGKHDITLNPYEIDNTSFFIKKESNKDNLEGEYYAFSFFNKYDLNDLNSPRIVCQTAAGCTYFFSKNGLALYHINTGKIINPALSENGNYFSNNNSFSNKKLIEYVEQDNNDSINNVGYAGDNDIFTKTGSYRLSTDLNRYYSYSNGIDFILTIKSITNSKLDLTIEIL